MCFKILIILFILVLKMSKEHNKDDEEQIELIIRSAMQTFQDTKVRCLSNWTIIQLKEYLYKTLTIKPVKFNLTANCF